MTAPSVTLRSLQNEETGIDISVPRFQEEEAPLGGTSILYEICVLTKLDLFKTRLHRNEDVVQFSIYKAYREVEDLYYKLNKKYPKAGLPPVPRSSTIDKYTSEEKVAALNRFMQAVSQNTELCHSSTFTHFIGINSQRLPSFTTPSSLPASDINATSSGAADELEKDVKPSDKVPEDLSDVFPKVKNVTPKTNEVTELIVENVDLFEEVKLTKEAEKSSDIKAGIHTGGLFDDFEDENLFTTKSIPAAVSSPKQTEKVTVVKPKRKEPEEKLEIDKVDDSQIIIKDRKLGDISLFDEQDLGDYVTKEEEALFLVTSNDNEKSKKNVLLFSDQPESIDTHPELHENLEDLLNLNPLPTSPALPKVFKSKSELEEEKTVSSNQTQNLPKRPVPLPRKKSLGKTDNDETNIITRPEVLPRKVFLTKPEVPSKPVPSSTTRGPDPQVSRMTKPPPISAKPVLPPKPKPPPKTTKPTLHKDSKNLDVVNANEPSKIVENQNTMSNLADDLNELDILKYIEQEQKTLESEPSLFD